MEEPAAPPQRQTSPSQRPSDHHHRLSNFRRPSVQDIYGEFALHRAHQQKSLFADASEMKAKLHAQLSKPEYDVAMYYKDQGFAQKIARNFAFERLTLFIITLNAIWIFIDTDYNPSSVLSEAPVGFQVVEQLFCSYFVFEWVIRFSAFKEKLHGLRDSWFVFDTLLMLLFVFDTWIMYFIIMASGGSSGQGFGDTSILRIFRLLRLTRMARMAKILKAVPELAILLKGMGAAMRSIGFTLTLLFVLLYIFGIAFRHLCGNQADFICAEYFSTVPRAAHTLLIHGALMDSLSEILIPLEKYSIGLLLVFYVFLLLAALTVMNMLIGLFCDVVNTTAEVERESLIINYVKEQLQKIMTRAGMQKVLTGDSRINKEEFLELIQNREAAAILSEVGVDVVGLIDFAEFIFKEDLFELEEGEVKSLSFANLVEVVLELRGNNTATVRDVVDLRKFVQLKVSSIETKLDFIAHNSRQLRETHLSETCHDVKVATKNGSKKQIDSCSRCVAPDTTERRTSGAIQEQEQAIANRNNGLVYSEADSVPDLSMQCTQLLQKDVADSSPILGREEATLFKDFKQSVDRLVLENQKALATLQEGNERLLAELGLLKSFGKSFAAADDVEGKISQLSGSVCLTLESLASLKHSVSAMNVPVMVCTNEEITHGTAMGNRGNNHEQESLDPQPRPDGDMCVQKIHEPGASENGDSKDRIPSSTERNLLSIASDSAQKCGNQDAVDPGTQHDACEYFVLEDDQMSQDTANHAAAGEAGVSAKSVVDEDDFKSVD